MSKEDPIPYVTIKDISTEKFKFCVEGYTRPEDYIGKDDWTWVNVSFRINTHGKTIEGERWESLEDGDIDNIRDNLRKLLAGKMIKPEKMLFAEMDFIFKFDPKSEQKLLTIEIYNHEDAKDIKVHLDKEEAKKLLDYLEDVTKATQPLNDTLRSLRE